MLSTPTVWLFGRSCPSSMATPSSLTPSPVSGPGPRLFDGLDAEDGLIDCGALGRLAVPVSIIFGESDRYLNPSLAAEIAGLFKDPAFHLVHGAAHWPQYDQPEVVAQLLKGARTSRPRTRSQINGQYSTGLSRPNIERALVAAGKDLEHLQPADLDVVEDFHTLGRIATSQLAELAEISGHDRVLDAGSGIGGTTRFLADRYGCRVTAIDLTEEYCQRPDGSIDSLAWTIGSPSITET